MKKYYVWVFLWLTAPIFAISQVPGSVVAYSPAASGLYIGSPSICILSNGDYLASHDLFGPNSKEFERPNSRIYRSQDKGKTWSQIAEINGQFWSKLFVHEKGLYFMGTSKHHGNTIIRKSTDSGQTWTEPTDGENGLLLAGEYHCAPMPLTEHNGRLWRAMEDAMGPIKKWGKRYGAFMMSIPLGADPMKAANWTSSNVLRYDSTLLNGNFGGWIEGNAVADPNGQLWDVLRVDDKSTLEEKAAFVRISADGKTATFDRTADFVRFPGSSKKFSIRYDPKSKRYWTIANYIPQEVKAANAGKNPASIRNTQALFSSKDLRNWELHTILLQHPEVIKHGFQYVDWLFEGKDIIFLSRTAFDDDQGGAHNNHDANYLTFHRIRKFRKIGVLAGY
ncbi:sialidase family protein [Runella slithyformis]|uniref:Periplasmic protein n=1 Tax=Runella slithyformis (strain ATCC 29530 / DSM 19594 / LMG 11500 / NCIMB 11436 / LSU 4) TaxID=761193 RepID=A0A7U3ZFW6_RUNSL|nr:sialidase family protein [Runella slithyformis]AEI46467.1 periplasmic protein [Runella slithyformis DSM 19594]